MVPPAFWILSAILLGGIFGSYVNMAAHRLPRGISTWKRSRSFCPKCQHQLAWYDNLPIVSFLMLRGNCRYCHVPIPPRYLYTELVTAALFGLCAYQYFSLNGGYGGPMPLAWFCLELFLIVDLMILSVVDLELWLIPEETTWWWIPVGFLLAVLFPDDLHPSKTLWISNPALGIPSPVVNALLDSFSGLAMAAGFLWAMNPIVASLVLVRNKLRGIPDPPPEAMGLGDVHLLGFFGAMVGWKLALMATLIGVMIGAITGISGILWNKFQRWRLGDKWKPPPQPSFDLPEDGTLYEPRLWLLPLFGTVVLLVASYLSQRIVFVPGGPRLDHYVPYYLLIGIGVLLWLAFPFYLALKSIGKFPGGAIVENTAGVKEEVYSGNYIPFGPSLAAGCLIAVLWDPMLRAVAGWFFAGTPGPAPSVFAYATVAGNEIAAFLATVIGTFNKWIMTWFGVGKA